MDNRIRLMTHNVWNCDGNHKAWEEKGEDCSAKARVSSLVQVYLDTMPDIIGGQEVSALMADLLKEETLKAGLSYTLVWGRFTPILYRADKFELVDSAFGTYPVEIEGLDGTFNDWQSKAWNLAVFRQKQNGKLFIFATTHLWWMSGDPDNKEYQAYSDEAREYQVGLLIEQIERFRAKYNCPAVVVGDLNTDYNSKAVTRLFKSGFRHAHDIATEYADDTVGYHYCFPAGYEKYYYDRPFERAIDHILVLGEPQGAVKRFERYSPEYYLPISDHSPAFMDIEW